jgi:hypothetical protein
MGAPNAKKKIQWAKKMIPIHARSNPGCCPTANKIPLFSIASQSFEYLWKPSL